MCVRGHTCVRTHIHIHPYPGLAEVHLRGLNQVIRELWQVWTSGCGMMDGMADRWMDGLVDRLTDRWELPGGYLLPGWAGLS